MRNFTLLFVLLAVTLARAADFPGPIEGSFPLRDFRFASGEVLPELRLHYRTIGAPRKDPHGVVRNAVLILHGTTGSGANFLRPEFAGELFGEGQPLDATDHYIILPDGIGHGESSKPSDGLRVRFPRYGYRDMIAAQHRLLTEGLKVDHLRLVMGTSMGGMHTWLWGQTYPEFVDALMPLERIRAPLVAINFEDDLINPPELGILEREIRRVVRGKAVLIPRSDRTRGHGTHTLAAVWKYHLIRLLDETERRDIGQGD
jgi:homoserine O-acetyltransferase/O-succinyltransferase